MGLERTRAYTREKLGCTNTLIPPMVFPEEGEDIPSALVDQDTLRENQRRVRGRIAPSGLAPSSDAAQRRARVAPASAEVRTTSQISTVSSLGHKRRPLSQGDSVPGSVSG